MAQIMLMNKKGIKFLQTISGFLKSCTRKLSPVGSTCALMHNNSIGAINRDVIRDFIINWGAKGIP